MTPHELPNRLNALIDVVEITMLERRPYGVMAALIEAKKLTIKKIQQEENLELVRRQDAEAKYRERFGTCDIDF